MRKSFVAPLLVFGAATLAMPALADLGSSQDIPGKLLNVQMAEEMRSRAARLGTSSNPVGSATDTTWVGYNPAYAGSNYWSIGVGFRRPPGAYGPGKGDIPPIKDVDTGYWDWDHPVHGDSLQGWWPMRHDYVRFYVASLNDKARSWSCTDVGNSISYVINQGPGYRRTYGVTSAWHEDVGENTPVLDPAPEKSDVNPHRPHWHPLAGSMSAWCGLRGHGDVTQVDALTGNPYNTDAYEELAQISPGDPGAPDWVNHRFPGYASQWDQMLYRDIDISAADTSAFVTVGFKYRTHMSTGKGLSATSRCGWFDKDPLAVVAGNFISSSDADLEAPIDSFMVYVGCPVADTVGAEWLGSDGTTHTVFDPVRRWFGELIQANAANGHYELFTTYGNDPPIVAPADTDAVATKTATRNVTYGHIKNTWGNKIRLVFRVKTNRGFDDAQASNPGAYNSGYLGAAQLDDVTINLGAGPVALGDFETKGDIDNGPKASALDFWKTSSKPPAIVHHVHDLSDLIYQDLCGQPGAINRVCDLAGNVISMGDHDLGEAFNGPFGTSEQERYEGITSPTVNLAYGTFPAKNNMGLDAQTAVYTAQAVVGYQIYTGNFALRTQGSGWQIYAKCYPNLQSDGTRTWSTMMGGPFQFFQPDKLCARDVWPLGDFDQVHTSNASGIPDSIRINLRKITQCWRFGITANCGLSLGGYWDNVSLGLVDGALLPMSALIWEFFQDTFPANETTGLPGFAEFDTTTALIKGAINGAPLTGNTDRYDIPNDSLLVQATGDSVEVQLKFRIFPGPGNYVDVGDPCSGLRAVATDTTRIASGDGSFWSEYIDNPGKDKDDMPFYGSKNGSPEDPLSPFDCKSGGPLRFDQRWNELVWCNARMDSAEQNLFPIEVRNINTPVGLGVYSTTYHEDDKHFAALGLRRHRCFLVDTLLAVNSTNITCSTVPAWVTDGGAPYKTGYNDSAYTTEGTKIIPDGLLTPGSHVEYFYQKKVGGVPVSTVPDTNMVVPQNGETQNFDGHRWQQFSVLPDAWKFSSYGGLGKACMLYVDWNDRNGTELVWVSVADSIGATSDNRRGGHNGWKAKSKEDVNDRQFFVNKNMQPGTSWDMYGVKACESLNSQQGSIGARLANRTPGTYMDDKWAKSAPTPEMLDKYYRIMMILTGGLNTGSLIGPFDDRGQDDTEVIRQFVLGGTAELHRGLFCQGDAFEEDLDFNGNAVMEGLLSVSLRNVSYIVLSANGRPCIDLIPQAPITNNGDVYGIRNTCLQTLDVLNAEGDGVPASFYEPVGVNTYISGVFTEAEPAGNPNNHWQALIDGFDTFNLRSRLCDKPYGRLAYFWNVYTNIFGKICSVAGTGQQTTEVPNNPNGQAFVDFAGIGNNPLRQGSAIIHLTLAKADRVTVKIYDVSGRLVRTLADGQMFQAGKVDPKLALTWDGLDNGGRRVGRGAYFVSVRYQNSRYETSRKMIVLK